MGRLWAPGSRVARRSRLGARMALLASDPDHYQLCRPRPTIRDGRGAAEDAGTGHPTHRRRSHRQAPTRRRRVGWALALSPPKQPFVPWSDGGPVASALALRDPIARADREGPTAMGSTPAVRGGPDEHYTWQTSSPAGVTPQGQSPRARAIASTMRRGVMGDTSSSAPRPFSASLTALVMAAGGAMAPPSPRPFWPKRV